MHMSTKAEILMKAGLAFAEIFGGICRFLPHLLPSCCKNFNFSLCNLKVTIPTFT